MQTLFLSIQFINTELLKNTFVDNILLINNYQLSNHDCGLCIFISIEGLKLLDIN